MCDKKKFADGGYPDMDKVLCLADSIEIEPSNAINDCATKELMEALKKTIPLNMPLRFKVEDSDI